MRTNACDPSLPLRALKPCSPAGTNQAPEPWRLTSHALDVSEPSNTPATVWLAFMVTVKAGVPTPVWTPKQAATPSGQVTVPPPAEVALHKVFSHGPLRSPV